MSKMRVNVGRPWGSSRLFNWLMPEFHGCSGWWNIPAAAEEMNTSKGRWRRWKCWRGFRGGFPALGININRRWFSGWPAWGRQKDEDSRL